MSNHRREVQRRKPVVEVVLALVGVPALLLVAVTRLPSGDDAAAVSDISAAVPTSETPTTVSTPTPTPTSPPTPKETDHAQPARGINKAIARKLKKALEAQADATLTTNGPLGEVTAPVGKPVEGDIRMSVANIPNTRADARWASSVGALVNPSPDFVSLNEVYKHSNEGIEAVAPGYTVHRALGPENTPGAAGQSMNNALLYRTDTWDKLAGGMVKVVNDDRGFLRGKGFLWDRFAVWAILQRKTDGAIISVVSTHMPTNPRRYPRTHGAPQNRAALYGSGMDIILSMTNQLGQYGPVLVAGDMNSHPTDGAWAAAPKMATAGYGYVKDQGVMYLFFKQGISVVSNQQIRIYSDHPAIITTLNMNGAGPLT